MHHLTARFELEPIIQATQKRYFVMSFYPHPWLSNKLFIVLCLCYFLASKQHQPPSSPSAHPHPPHPKGISVKNPSPHIIRSSNIWQSRTLRDDVKLKFTLLAINEGEGGSAVNCEIFLLPSWVEGRGEKMWAKKITLKKFCHNGGKGVSFEIGENAGFRVHSQFVAKSCEFQLGQMSHFCSH